MAAVTLTENAGYLESTFAALRRIVVSGIVLVAYLGICVYAIAVDAGLYVYLALGGYAFVVLEVVREISMGAISRLRRSVGSEKLLGVLVVLGLVTMVTSALLAFRGAWSWQWVFLVAIPVAWVTVARIEQSSWQRRADGHWEKPRISLLGKISAKRMWKEVRGSVLLPVVFVIEILFLVGIGLLVLVGWLAGEVMLGTVGQCVEWVAREAVRLGLQARSVWVRVVVGGGFVALMWTVGTFAGVAVSRL